MKIRPVILCGGAGTRLWSNSKNHQAKQFIDFGNWTLLGKTLERTKASIYDSPIISTNKKYLREVKQHLKKNKINKYKIVLEPAKRNTAPAILSTALIKDIPNDQPLMFFTADHLIEKMNIFNKTVLATIISTAMVASVQAENHEVDPLTVYGKLNVTVQSNDIQGDSRTRVQSNASRLGVKGGLDLGDHLEAFYTIEYEVDTDSADKNNFKARNQFVGLKSRIGAVSVGRNDTMLKMSEGKVDQFNDLAGDIKSLFAGQDRMAQTVTYMTPAMGHFKAGVTYVAEASSGQWNRDGYSLAAMYGDKKLKETPVFASIAYNSDVNGYEIMRATAQAKLAGFKLGAMYQQQELNYLLGHKVSLDSNDGFLFSVSYQINDIVLKGQYQDMDGTSWSDGEESWSAGGDSWSLGGDYMLGKPTKLFAFYTERSYDILPKSDSYFGLGLEHKF